MNRLLEQAIAELSALPPAQQEAVAMRILDEVKRQTASRKKWAQVAHRLASIDALKGKSEAFARHTRELRDSFRLRGAPDA